MTLRQFQGLLVHWKKAPPAHLGIRRLERLVKAWMGVAEETERPQAPRPPPTEAEIASLVALAQGGAR